MQRYRVSCHDAHDERLAELTIEAPDKTVAEMMALTQLHAAATPLADRVEKLAVRLEGETAQAGAGFAEQVRPSANETIRAEETCDERALLGDELKIYDPEKLAGLSSSAGTRMRRAAIVAGTLLLSAGLLWAGWSSLHSGGAAPSAASVEDAAPAPRLVSGDPVATQTAGIGEAVEKPMQSVPMDGNIDRPASGSGDRHVSAQTDAQPAARPKTSPAVQQKNASASSAVHNKPKTRPTPVPETKPTTIAGWVVREVADGRAVLQGPSGVWKVARGDTVPGLGTVDSIVMWGNRWIVATSRGLITTQ